jgi:hypothetical protein
MYRQTSAAQTAKRLLDGASQQLGAVSPARVLELSRVLDDSMPYPVGDPAYDDSRMLEADFNETAGDSLAFVVDPGGPRASAQDRVQIATKVMAELVGHHMGRDARTWFEGRAEPQSSVRSNGWGAALGSALDRDGVRESYVTYDWGPELMETLPATLYRIARAAVNTLPGLRPVFSTIRCGRAAGSQQVTFELDRATALSSFQPMMDALGLGAQHASLMTTAAFLMGARFTLPPDTARVTLRPVRGGVEMRLDINLDALPDPPERLLPLLRMQMTERPAGTRALDRWLMALTPEGFPGPGTVSTLTVWVRPNMPARVGLFLRPFALAPAAAGTPAANPEARRDSVAAAWA